MKKRLSTNRSPVQFHSVTPALRLDPSKPVQTSYIANACRLRITRKTSTKSLKPQSKAAVPTTSQAENRVTSPISSPSCDVQVPKGLRNLGNTCYLNVSLLTLYSIPLFRSYFTLNPPLSNQLFILISRFCRQIANCRDILQIGSVVKGFNDGFQHCAHHFITTLLATLDREFAKMYPDLTYNRIGDGSMLGKYRVGKCVYLHERMSVLCENVFTCSKCHTVSVRNYSYTRSLSLPIPRKYTVFQDYIWFEEGNFYINHPLESCIDFISRYECIKPGFRFMSPGRISVQTCLQYLLRVSLMTLENCLPCGTCHSDTPHYKQSFIRHITDVLLLHFQRYDESTALKLHSKVEFCEELDLREYIPTTGVYDLTAVVYHIGTLYSGHYTVTMRINGTWYDYNDDYVTEVRGPEVTNAYLLCYVRRVM